MRSEIIVFRNLFANWITELFCVVMMVMLSMILLLNFFAVVFTIDFSWFCVAPDSIWIIGVSAVVSLISQILELVKTYLVSFNPICAMKPRPGILLLSFIGTSVTRYFFFFLEISFVGKLMLIHRGNIHAYLVILRDANDISFLFISPLVHSLFIVFVRIPIRISIWVCSTINQLLVLHFFLVLYVDGKLFAELWLEFEGKLLYLTTTWICIFGETKLDDVSENCSITTCETNGLVCIKVFLLLSVVTVDDSSISTCSTNHMTWSNVSKREVCEERATWSQLWVLTSIVEIPENRYIQNGQKNEEVSKCLCGKQEQCWSWTKLSSHGCCFSL